MAEIILRSYFIRGEKSLDLINRSTIAADGGMTAYHPVGLIDLIAEMMGKKRELTTDSFKNIKH